MQRFRQALTLFDDYREMLSDEVRMSAYARAIEREIRPGDIVLDLGAGLGILSFLAARAGAKRVYAVEKGDSIELAKQVAKKNGLEDIVVFIAANSRDVELDQLDHRKVDVILSETLGSFGVDENTLGFTIDARDRLLAPGGRLLPNRLELWLAPIDSTQEHARVDFWRDIRGLDFSPAIDQLLGRMSLATFSRKQLLAEPGLYQELDLSAVTRSELDGALRFELQRKGTIHGLAGWFRVELTAGITIDTAPWKPRTHWQQAFFPFRQPINVIEGDSLDVRLRVRPKATDSDDTAVSYDYFCNQESPRPATSTKVGRNDACPCGSGAKYKRCCGG